MLINHLYQDKTTDAPLVFEKYHWIYDPTLQLLVLFPHVALLSARENHLWLKIIDACQLQQWSDWFVNQSNQNFKSGHFIWNEESIEALYQRFKPKYLWNVSEQEIKRSGFSCKIFQSASPRFWLKQPLIKKQVWLTWLDIQKDLV